VELWFGTTRLGFVYRKGVFFTRGCFLLRLPSSQLRGCCGFWLRLLRPGRLPGGHFRFPGSFRDRLGRGIWSRGWWGSGLDNTVSSNEVIPPLAQVHLLGRGPGSLFFRSGKLGCGGSFGHGRAPALQVGPSLLSTSHSPGSLPRFPPQPEQWGCSRGVEQSPERWEPPHATHRGALPQFRCVCPKRWQP
jgi:hypothetical protein